ncbi:Uncharacterised protein [Candidatus Anstonella stagnisolia]|nr:Uncharacterised protein [Candidatus Anstonella stagnisolia]
MGRHPLASKPNYIFVALALLLVLLAFVLYGYMVSALSFNQSYVLLQAIGIVATISLLYFAYVNVLSSRTKDVAAAELAVRPVLIWKIEYEGKRLLLSYKTIKHPIYDLGMELELAGKKLEVFDHHLDVSDSANGNNERTQDITSFAKNALGGREGAKMLISISYHSEVGGRYEAYFSKELKATRNGLQLLDRNILWAKYPWREEKVYFD